MQLLSACTHSLFLCVRVSRCARFGARDLELCFANKHRHCQELMKRSIVYFVQYQIGAPLLQYLFISKQKKFYTLSHPENDRDVTERARGNKLQDAFIYALILGLIHRLRA